MSDNKHKPRFEVISESIATGETVYFLIDNNRVAKEVESYQFNNDVHSDAKLYLFFARSKAWHPGTNAITQLQLEKEDAVCRLQAILNLPSASSFSKPCAALKELDILCREIQALIIASCMARIPAYGDVVV